MSEPRKLRCYAYVNQPYPVVRDAVVSDPAALFDAAGTAASTRATAVAADLEVDVGAIQVGARIEIELGKVQHDVPPGPTQRHRTRLPLRWKASRAPGLFPTVIAELSLYPLGPDETQLDLDCEYHPPGGALGRAADAMVGHRIAEAALHRFVEEVATRLRDRLADA